MKRLIIAGLLLTSVSAFALMGMGHGMHGYGKMSMMSSELNLTSEQKTKIREIRKESRSEKFELMDQMEVLRDKTQTSIMGVLSNEQKEKFIELRKERKQNNMDKKAMKMCKNGKMGNQ